MSQNRDTLFIKIAIKNGKLTPEHGEKILATLFKAFVSTKANGTGLGLAIVRKIVEAHGGSIDVHNSTLGGARFELRLPSA